MQAEAGSRPVIAALRLRLARWISPEKKNNPAADHITGLKDISSLELAIDILAAAMPNGAGQVINGPIHDDTESRKAMLRHMVGGGSVLYAIDWQIHASISVTPSMQDNGRTMLSVMPRGHFQQEGSQ